MSANGRTAIAREFGRERCTLLRSKLTDLKVETVKELRNNCRCDYCLTWLVVFWIALYNFGIPSHK